MQLSFYTEDTVHALKCFRKKRVTGQTVSLLHLSHNVHDYTRYQRIMRNLLHSTTELITLV